MSRSGDIVRLRPILFASPAELIDQQDVLRAAMGRMSALVEVVLLLAPAGLSLSAADAIETANTRLDVTDALLQQWRVVVDGSGAGAAVEVTVGGVTVGEPALAAARGVVASAWSAPTLPAGEVNVAASVTGAGATLYTVRLQARTLRAPAR